MTAKQPFKCREADLKDWVGFDEFLENSYSYCRDLDEKFFPIEQAISDNEDETISRRETSSKVVTISKRETSSNDESSDEDEIQLMKHLKEVMKRAGKKDESY